MTIDTKELRVSAANSVRDLALLPSEVLELLDRLEAAEKDVALKEQVIDALGSELNSVANENTALRAKVEQMERQAPVGVLHVGSYYGEELQDWEFEADQRVCDRLNERHVSSPTSLKLYTLPGAQSVPKAVAYLDLGTGGYMDIGTDLTDEALAALPKGRHMLGIVGTYGVDGYVPAQPAPSINEGVRKVTLGFRWESEAQHHIPTIEIEFDPVSPDSPNDAKGWQDRDRIASMLSPEAKP